MISDSVIATIRREAELHEKWAGSSRLEGQRVQAEADQHFANARNHTRTALEHRRALAELIGEPVVEHTATEQPDRYIDQARTIAGVHAGNPDLPAPIYVISDGLQDQVYGTFHTGEVASLDQLTAWAEAMCAEITTYESATSIHHTITFDWSGMPVKLTVVDHQWGGGQ